MVGLVLAVDGVPDRDVPLRLTMSPGPAAFVVLPGGAPDAVAGELRIGGALSWARRAGMPQHRRDGVVVQPPAAGLVLTWDAHTRRRSASRSQGHVAVMLRNTTAGEIAGGRVSSVLVLW